MRPADLEQRPVSDLVPYARNSRTHSPEQVAQIAASIREFGFTNPVLVDGENGIIAGHGRVLAARHLGLTTVPVLVLDHLTKAQRRAYVIADNKLALNAGWDPDMLKVELSDLLGEGFDLDLTGFGRDELDALLAEQTDEGLTDPDAIPEVAEPVTELGEVWLLGKHRIVCGDSTDTLVVEKVLAGAEPHVCLTDPPYGVGFAYNSHKDTPEALDEIVAGFMPLVTTMCRTVLVTCGVANIHRYPKPDWILSWSSSAGVGSGPWGFCCWQPVLAYGKDPYLQNKMGRRPDSYSSNASAPKDVKHTCPKPVEVWEWFMDRADPSKCANFFEPFSGSGTTLICCERTGRVSFSIEKDPAYVDVAVRRWQEFTGKVATLEGDGRTFDEVASDRLHKAAA
jgi:hypothetical protein